LRDKQSPATTPAAIEPSLSLSKALLAPRRRVRRETTPAARGQITS